MRRSRNANGGGGAVAAGADRDEAALGPERIRDDEVVCACVAVQDAGRHIDVVGFWSKSIICRVWVVPARIVVGCGDSEESEGRDMEPRMTGEAPRGTWYR